jgi:hypothetical protein
MLLFAHAAASITSHELTEAITDPELNAWYSSPGAEIRDICAWNYGSNTWNAGRANEFWPISYTLSNSFGTSFELQQEYDNPHGELCAGWALKPKLGIVKLSERCAWREALRLCRCSKSRPARRSGREHPTHWFTTHERSALVSASSSHSRLA